MENGEEILKRGRDIGMGFPANRIDSITDDEYLRMIDSSVKVESGKVLYNGNPSVSSNGEALSLTETVTKIFQERKWVGSPAEVDPPVFTTLSQVKEFILKKGLNLNGEDAGKIINDAIKNNPGFNTRA